MPSKYEGVPVYKRSLFSWLWETSFWLKILLLAVVVIMVYARVLPVEMQKKIVNQAIGLKKLDLLWTYCIIYILAVFTATGLKYVTNALQAVIGQQILANMRKGLYHHLLTLPVGFYRKTQPGMVVSALVSEIASAGDFLGMAVAIPITNILTLLAFAAYLIYLNPLMALVSLIAYPLVLAVVPFLQRRTNKWNKRRVDATRDLSSKIGESITGIHEIHGNASYAIENKKFDNLVDRLMTIRVRWNLYRYAVKVINNFINNLSPFFMFLLGGWLAIHGKLELGALVAFLSAQEKLNDPWKEIMEFYQAYQESNVRYKRTMEYFEALPEHKLIPPEGAAPAVLDNKIELEDLGFVTETGIMLLNNVQMTLEPGEHLALVGFSGSGKSTLAQCVGQLYKYTGGSVRIGGREVADLSKWDMANNIGFVSQSPFIFTGTIRENLLYSWVARLGKDEPQPEDPMPTLDDMISVLQQTGIFVDVLRFGLNTILDRKIEKDRDLAAKLVQIRQDFQRDYGGPLADYVEFFEVNRYLRHSSVLENLTFGSANEDDFSEARITENPFFLAFLDDADLTRPLLSLGAELARQTVDILGNIPDEALFFENSPIASDEIEDFKKLNDRLAKKMLHQLDEEDRKRLLMLALRFTPGRHKMVALSRMLEELIVQGRSLFMESVAAEHPGALSFYKEEDYIYSQTILNNILFGKITTENQDALEKINQSIIQLLVAEDYLESIVEIGMNFHVGSKGDRLSGGQRQKLAIARVFLKAPRVLIMDEATSALDNKSQARIQNLLENKWKGKTTLISVVHRLDIIKNYDKIAVMKAGKIVEMGPYEELMARKGMLHELVHGRS